MKIIFEELKNIGKKLTLEGYTRSEIEKIIFDSIFNYENDSGITDIPDEGDCLDTFSDFRCVNKKKKDVWISNYKGQTVFMKKYILDIFDRVLNVSVIASDLKIGPKVISYYTCKYDGEKVGIIVSEVLPITFTEYIESNGRILDKEYFNKLIDVLYIMYRNGITYDDLWDDNIMIDSEGNVRLIDFDDSYIQEPQTHEDSIMNLINLLKKGSEVGFSFYDRTKATNISDIRKQGGKYILEKYKFLPKPITKKSALDIAREEGRRLQIERESLALSKLKLKQ